MISHTSAADRTATHPEKRFRRVRDRCYGHRIIGDDTESREERAVYESTALIQRRTAKHRLCPGAPMSGTRLGRARFTA